MILSVLLSSIVSFGVRDPVGCTAGGVAVTNLIVASLLVPLLTSCHNFLAIYLLKCSKHSFIASKVSDGFPSVVCRSPTYPLNLVL